MESPDLTHRAKPTGAPSSVESVHGDHESETDTVERPLALGGLAGVLRSADGDPVDPLGGTAAQSDVVAALRRRQGRGDPLPDEVAAPLGEHMGTDLGGVRIHADNEADTIARSVQATAFTHGSDIYFTKGSYQPGSEPGKRLLAHELAHVAQHRSGADRGASGAGPTIGRADDPLERAADRVADGAVGALRRRASAAPQAAAPAAGSEAAPGTEIRRWFGSKWFGKKKKVVDKKVGAAMVAAPAATAAATPTTAAATAAVGGPATRQRAVATVQAPAKLPAAAAAIVEAAAPAPATAPPTTPLEALAPAEATSAVAPAAEGPVAAGPAAAEPVAAGPAAAEPVAAGPAAAEPVAAGPVADPTKAVAAGTAPAEADAAVVPVVKTAKEDFDAAVTGKAPKDPAEAKTRMTGLRAMLTVMTPAERASISTDKTLMAKAELFVGSFEYMSLVTAVGMSANTPAKPGAAAADKPKHLSGAQADTFIQSEMGKIAHLKGYMDTAVGAGKKADGFVAVVDADDWKKIYEQQNKGKKAGTDDLSTNAFIANTHPDRPAIIHEDRGTASTAIHESMHRYSELKVLHTYGSPLNEGMTEYFTRLITDKDGKPLNGKASNRANYQANWTFIDGTLRKLLGANTVAAQTALAEIYFAGKVDGIKTAFTDKCTAAKLTKPKTEELWKAFAKALSDGNWADAKANLPPDAPAAPAVAPAAVGAPAK